MFVSYKMLYYTAYFITALSSINCSVLKFEEQFYVNVILKIDKLDLANYQKNKQRLKHKSWHIT